jgi:hypothetical protein
MRGREWGKIRGYGNRGLRRQGLRFRGSGYREWKGLREGVDGSGRVTGVARGTEMEKGSGVGRGGEMYAEGVEGRNRNSHGREGDGNGKGEEWVGNRGVGDTGIGGLRKV